MDGIVSGVFLRLKISSVAWKIDRSGSRLCRIWRRIVLFIVKATHVDLPMQKLGSDH